jgi:hypothetical protein
MKSHPLRNLMFALCFWAVAASSVGAQQPNSDGVSLGIATSQTGAPVGLRGHLASAGTFLYDTAKVENLSPKPILAVTFGVLIADPSGKSPFTLLRAHAVSLSLAPGEQRDVNVGLLPASRLEDLKRSLSSTPTVTIGVLSVEWEDGTKWVFDLPDAATDFSTGTGRLVQATQR